MHGITPQAVYRDTVHNTGILSSSNRNFMLATLHYIYSHVRCAPEAAGSGTCSTNSQSHVAAQRWTEFAS